MPHPTHILIDYENIQPTAIAIPPERIAGVHVFIGAQQSKISADLERSLQGLGGKFQLIRVMKSGHNALDFVMAFHLGKLLSKNPDAQFILVSKDKGFDALVEQVSRDGGRIRRVDEAREAHGLSAVSEGNAKGLPRTEQQAKSSAKVGAVPPRSAGAIRGAGKPKRVPNKAHAKALAATPQQTDEVTRAIITRLLKQHSHQCAPSTLKTLEGTVAASAGVSREHPSVMAMVSRLQQVGVVEIEGQRVRYLCDVQRAKMDGEYADEGRERPRA